MSEKNLPELTKEAKEILESVKKLSVMELANLVKNMEEEFWVSAAAPMAMAMAPAWAWASDAPVEKTQFDAILKSAWWDNKVWVIKIVREITWLWLKEAKEIVDAAPKAIKEKVSKEEAESIKAKLKEVWAEVEVK